MSELFTYEPPLRQASVSPTFAVIGTAHTHIYGMCEGLLRAGATLKCAALTDAEFDRRFPAKEASVEEILSDPEITLVVSAAIPRLRAQIGVAAMRAGKDFFVDKAPLITLDQLALVKEVLEETKRKYIVYYGESIDNPATIFARDLVARGVIGDIFHIEGTAPHRLNPESRPDWFWRKEDTGGLLIDLGSHQMHQFLDFAGCEAAKVESARAHNRFNAAHPEFEDFADVTLTADNGVTGYFRLDWCSPKGLSSWGDVRLVIEGERGSIELRKNLNVGTDENANHVFVVTEDGEYHASVTELAKSRFFENLLYDLEHRTEYAIKQSAALAAIELSIQAQNLANEKGLPSHGA